jgi:hypothetical protein
MDRAVSDGDPDRAAGRSFPIPELLHELSVDRVKRKCIGQYDRCGVHCPELPAMFMQPEQAELKGLSTDPG